MSYPLPKDPATANYLNMVRQRNKKQASRCFFCNKRSIGIDCKEHRVFFVCEDHSRPDNPNVIHRVYPQGMKVPDHMMDPNVGGWKVNK